MKNLGKKMNNNSDTEIAELELTETTDKQSSKLILHNDNHNSFHWVISCLMQVMRMSSTNAEQISYIVHHKGKCTIKSGSYEDLKHYKDALVDKGLSVTIET